MFQTLPDFVQIEDSDPCLITILCAEFYRILIDEHNLSIHDAAKLVNSIVTYKQHRDQKYHFTNYLKLESFNKLMPRHMQLMHAIGNKSIQHWLRSFTQLEEKDIQLNDLQPNLETKRDQAWSKLDRDIRSRIVQSQTGIYQYTWDHDFIIGINIHNAAICLTTLGDGACSDRATKLLMDKVE